VLSAYSAPLGTRDTLRLFSSTLPTLPLFATRATLAPRPLPVATFCGLQLACASQLASHSDANGQTGKCVPTAVCFCATVCVCDCLFCAQNRLLYRNRDSLWLKANLQTSGGKMIQRKGGRQCGRARPLPATKLSRGRVEWS